MKGIKIRTMNNNFTEFLKREGNKELKEMTNQEIYYKLLEYVKEEAEKKSENKSKKKIYYISAEFLIGKLLSNNLINLGIYKEIREELKNAGKKLSDIEELETEPSLGNGGLGRLAACFLESLSSLNYPVYGCGIRYRYGMFKQKIEDGYQVEVPDEWLKHSYPFELKRPEYACEVKFGGYVKVENVDGKDKFVQTDYNSVRAIPYDMPIVGYGNGIVNTLRIWDAEAIVNFSLSDFDKGEYQKAVEQENLARTICEVLYPNDNHYAGKELRLKQQYFFVSASVQRAVARFKEHHSDIKELPNKVVFQMNDTHPTVAVPELMRILLDEEGLNWDEAWNICSKTCAYTNHTIMAEALEKWPIDLFKRLLPRIYQIVEEIDRRFIEKVKKFYNNDETKVANMAILYDNQVRMAYMAIAGSFSVNGVARLHTEILKSRELKDFYEMESYKFNNKTNGVTQRRFLLKANPLLADWVTKRIGKDWITDLSQMRKLTPYADDELAVAEFMEIKQQNKIRLAEYIKKHNGIEVDVNSIFDVQVKRLHEFKRQLLNILHVMYLYNKLKTDPSFDMYPTTFIFGAKAAAGYRRAKLTIKLINSVADVINNDESINGKIKVVFIEDYKVSTAEIIFAAANVSEQISAASKEASGTSNMKFMMNGAITVGTLDGATVEIVEEVGRENAYIFGLSAEEVIAYEKNGNYDPKEIFNNNEEIRTVLMQLINGYYAPDDSERFREIYDSLLEDQGYDKADTYFILKDFMSYVNIQNEVNKAYQDRKTWGRKAVLQTAACGKFSSDRTVEDYVRDVWHLEKVYLQ